MTQQLTVGLVNLYDFCMEDKTHPEMTLDYNSNLALTGSNGAGKSVTMTLITPELFTFDLKRSVNLGSGRDRNIDAYLNDQQSYIYGKMAVNGEPLTLVTTYRLKTRTDVDKRAFIIHSHDIEFNDANQNPLNITDFKAQFRQKGISFKEYRKSRHYRTDVANLLYGTDLESFDRDITLRYTIANPNVQTRQSLTKKDGSVDEQKVGVFKVEAFNQTILAQLPSVANAPIVNPVTNESRPLRAELETCVQSLIEAHTVVEEVKTYQSKLNHLAKARHSVASKNRNHIKRIDDSIAQIKQALDSAQRKLVQKQELLAQVLEQYNVQNEAILRLTASIKDSSNTKNELSLKLATQESDIKHLKKERATLNATITSAQKEIDQAHQSKVLAQKELVGLNQEMFEFETRLSNLEEPPAPPFPLENWNAIEVAFKQVRMNQHDLAVKESQLKDLSDNLDALNAEKASAQARLEEAQSALYSDLEFQGMDTKTLEQHLSEKSVQANLAKSQAQTQIKTLSTDLKDAQRATKPKTHFVAENAIPLYETIEDFADHVSDKDRRIIENLMIKAGLTETLVHASHITEGIFL